MTPIYNFTFNIQLIYNYVYKRIYLKVTFEYITFSDMDYKDLKYPDKFIKGFIVFTQGSIRINYEKIKLLKGKVLTNSLIVFGRGIEHLLPKDVSSKGATTYSICIEFI